MSSPADSKSSLANNQNNQSAKAQPKEESKSSASQKDKSSAAKTEGSEDKPAQPLAPPPKPSQNASETPDYFNSSGGNSHFSLEPNPFEQSFGNPSGETPGKFGTLPSVASLTSPAPLGPAGTPGWQNSLRSGPLSPAMLSGPTGANGYFDESYRGSFPTPNESSLRTGLTPGGGGSMFPVPSPNSQAIFNSMQSGGATPGTLEFQRSAMNAAARSKMDATSSQNVAPNGQGINKQDYQPAQQQQPGQQDPFGNHSETDAVNSLYMLAQTGGRNANQFAVPNQSQNVNASMQGMQAQQQESSPTTRGQKQSIGSSTGGSENAEYDGEGAHDSKGGAKTRGGKKGNAGKATQNGRRKADETPVHTPANKKPKTAKAMAAEMDEMEESDDGSLKDEQEGRSSSGKKMTDEEKRKNFLERNRVAALKCRQRKKQWLANLQTKVEIFTAENDSLNAQVNQMREEIVNLKTLLIAHKDCPVSHQQGLGGNAMAQVIGDFNNPHGNPYGMGMPNANQMMSMQAGQGMQRS